VRRLLLIASLFFAIATLLVGCGAAETPVEEAEEEAGVEEVVPEEETRVEEVVEPAKPTPEEIQAKGCPEGQVSNEAGTACYDAEQRERAQEQVEQMQEERQRD
jgi:hypothetical protein